MDVTLCIVNFDGGRYLPRTLPAAAGLGRPVCFLDNASTDDSVDLACALLPKGSEALLLDANLGAGTARNVGYALAPTDRVLFIDNDVTVNAECVERLQRALDDDPDATFAMPCVLRDDDPETVQFDGATAHCSGLMTLENAGVPRSGLSTESRFIGSLVTACFLVDRTRWDGDELFDDLFFYLLEDHELGLRARLQGKKILSVPAATVLHGQGTVGMSLRETGRYTGARVTNVVLNRWKIVLKLYSLRTILLLGPSLLVFECFQLVGAAAKGWLGDWWRAVRRMLEGQLLLIWQRRASVVRRVRDGEVLEGGPIPVTAELHGDFLSRLGQKVLDKVVAFNFALVRRLL